jgi:hypothetical protein
MLHAGIITKKIKATRQPGSRAKNYSFRRIWTPLKGEKGFEGKRLMHTTHPLLLPEK